MFFHNVAVAAVFSIGGVSANTLDRHSKGLISTGLIVGTRSQEENFGLESDHDIELCLGMGVSRYVEHFQIGKFGGEGDRLIRQDYDDKSGLFFSSGLSCKSSTVLLKISPSVHYTAGKRGQVQFSTGIEMSKPIWHKFESNVGDNISSNTQLAPFDYSRLVIFQAGFTYAISRKLH